MFVVQIATPDGVGFDSQHDNVDDAKDALLGRMESADEETWGWITEVVAFTAMVGGTLEHA